VACNWCELLYLKVFCSSSLHYTWDNDQLCVSLFSSGDDIDELLGLVFSIVDNVYGGNMSFYVYCPESLIDILPPCLVVSVVFR